MTNEALLRGINLHKQIEELNGEIEDLTLLLTDNYLPIDTWVIDIRPNASHPYTRLEHRGLLRSFIIQIRDKAIEEKTEAEREFKQL